MIKFDINNRVAVVTGGAQGFGLGGEDVLRKNMIIVVTLPSKNLILEHFFACGAVCYPFVGLFVEGCR